MKLIDAVIYVHQEYNENYMRVQYRTWLPDGEDSMVGYCEVKKVGKSFEINSLDGDDYSLDDEITKYEYDYENSMLYIWYESYWS